jgi:hypothetical protein
MVICRSMGQVPASDDAVAVYAAGRRADEGIETSGKE